MLRRGWCKCLLAVAALLTSWTHCSSQEMKPEPQNLPPPSNIRLVNSELENEGRLEVRYDGQWGTVCDDGFSNVDASVACYQLRLGRQGETLHQTYGAGDQSSPIWLDDLRCVGNETALHLCPHRGWGSHNCGHYEDVSIRCTVVEPVSGIRLVGGVTDREGRLEIERFDVWGTVCDDWFTDVDVAVVCNMLGYGFVGTFLGNLYGPGVGQIWLDDVDCRGNETSVADCGHIGWGTHNCVHDEDVSISCYDCPDGFVHLPVVGGCYRAVTDKLQWSTAGVMCKAHDPDAHLVVIDNAAEQRALAQYLASSSVVGFELCQFFWTSGNRVDPSHPTPFIWRQERLGLEPDKLSVIQFMNWKRGQPDNAKGNSTYATESCISLYAFDFTFGWTDESCSEWKCSVCEIDQL